MVPMMAGQAAIAVKSPKTIIAAFDQRSGQCQSSLMKVNTQDMVHYSDDREDLIMVGKHGAGI